MPAPFSWLTVSLFALLLITATAIDADEAARSNPVAANSSSFCEPHFPYQNGWLGGDAAYSVPLEPGKSVWLFGDSLIRPPAAQSQKSSADRHGSKFIRNCIAISTCDDKQPWHVKYFWRNEQHGAPDAFFQSGTDAFWYWPLDGFMHKGRLYVALSMVKENPGNGVFSFEGIGVRLAKIHNPLAQPADWKVEYLKFVEGGGAWPGSSIAIDGDFANFFTLYEDNARHHQHMILTRVALRHLDHPAEHLEYLAADKSWKPGLERDNALVVIPAGSSEMSVRYHPNIARWVAVTGGGFLSDKIVIRTSPALEGPWSDPQVVFEMPEMNPKSPGYDRDTFGYAVKEHIQFAHDDKLLITYACNSFKLEKMLDNTSIYHPQPVWIDLPPPNK